MGTTFLDDLTVATLDKYTPTAIDNIIKGSSVLSYMTLKNRMMKKDSGLQIKIPLTARLNPNFGFYSYYKQVKIDPNSILEQATWKLYHASCAVSISDQEEQENTGAEEIVKLLTTKLENAKDTITEQLADYMFKTSQATSEDFRGLPLMLNLAAVNDTSVGGINQTTNSFWNNERIILGTTSGFPGTDFATYGLNAMRRLINNCAYGNDTPDVFFASQIPFEGFDKEVETKEYINKTTQAMAALGFDVLEYKGRPILYDKYAASNVDGYLYAVNSKHLYVAYNSKRWFHSTGFEPVASDINAKVSKILISLGLVADSLRTSGVVADFTS